MGAKNIDVRDKKASAWEGGTATIASRLHGPLDLRVETVEKPRIDAGDVLLEVKAASICGTDIHVYQHGTSVHPLVTGHEYSGIVYERGRDVKEFEEGDRVVGMWGVPCGGCWHCRRGKLNLCTSRAVFGISIDGSHAEFMRVPDARLVLAKLPKEVSFEVGALISCSLPTGICGVERAQVEVGSTIAVFGLGGVGISTVIAARVAGAGYIAAIDPIDYRRELAKRVGADISVGTEELAEIKTREEVAEAGGFDRTVIATTASPAIGQAIDVTRRGGRIAVVGDVREASIDWTHFHTKDIDIAGVLGMIGPDYVEKAVRLVRNGKIDLRQVGTLITHRLPLSNIGTAYEIFEKKEEKVLKIVVEP